MADEEPAEVEGEVPSEPHVRARVITVKRRVQLAEQLASKAVAAELDGDHKAAAELYRKAIDALTYLADTAGVAVNDITGTDDESG